MRKATRKSRIPNKSNNTEDAHDWPSTDDDSHDHSSHDHTLPILWVHEFNTESATEFIQNLQKLDASPLVSVIIIRVDSYGGEIYALLSMLEAIDQCETPIYTVCSGKAMSAGAVLLAAGDKRFIGKYSTVMIHQASSDASGTNAQVQVDAAETQRLQEILLTLLAKFCSTTKPALKQLIKDKVGADIYLTPRQALDLGIVDAIGLPKIKKVVRWEISGDIE